jgi:hypothetical protein
VLPEPGALHVTRRQDLLELELPEPDMSAYGGGASGPPVLPALSTVEGSEVQGLVPPALSTVEGSNVEGDQARGRVPDEVAKRQPTQMTLDFESAPDPQVNADPNVNPTPL